MSDIQWTEHEIEAMKAMREDREDHVNPINMIWSAATQREVLDAIDDHIRAKPSGKLGRVKVSAGLYRRLLGMHTSIFDAPYGPQFVTRQKLRIERANFLIRETANKMENS